VIRIELGYRVRIELKCWIRIRIEFKEEKGEQNSLFDEIWVRTYTVIRIELGYRVRIELKCWIRIRIEFKY
jgi:hypothetical protein